MKIKKILLSLLIVNAGCINGMDNIPNKPLDTIKSLLNEEEVCRKSIDKDCTREFSGCKEILAASLDAQEWTSNKNEKWMLKIISTCYDYNKTFYNKTFWETLLPSDRSLNFVDICSIIIPLGSITIPLGFSVNFAFTFLKNTQTTAPLLKSIACFTLTALSAWFQSKKYQIEKDRVRKSLEYELDTLKKRKHIYRGVGYTPEKLTKYIGIIERTLKGQTLNCYDCDDKGNFKNYVHDLNYWKEFGSDSILNCITYSNTKDEALLKAKEDFSWYIFETNNKPYRLNMLQLWLAKKRKWLAKKRKKINETLFNELFDEVKSKLPNQKNKDLLTLINISISKNHLIST